MEEYFVQIVGSLGLANPYLIFLLMGIVCAAAFITSAFGIGGGVLMTPLFIFFLPPKFAVGLLAPLALLIAFAGTRQYWGQWNPRHIMILLPSSLLGVWLGTYLLAEISPALVSRIVGTLGILFGSIQYLTLDRPEWKTRLRPAPWQGVGLGFGSGITSALSHSAGIVFSFYLLPHSRSKEMFVATTVFLFSVQASLKMGTFFYYKILTVPMLFLSMTLMPALLLGSFAGKRLNQRLSNRLFLRLISLVIMLMGIRLILY